MLSSQYLDQVSVCPVTKHSQKDQKRHCVCTRVAAALLGDSVCLVVCA